MNLGPKIALYEPDIPQNTAAIIRTCSCLGAMIEIIEPCGFIFNDKRFKRVVLDYLDKKMIKFYYIRITLLLFSIILFQSCKSVEIAKQKIFDYSQFEKITLLSNNLEINNDYIPTYEEPFIDHTLDITPFDRLSEWIKTYPRLTQGEKVVEFESLASGLVRKIVVSEGDVVPVGTIIAVIGEKSEDISAFLSDDSSKESTPEEKPIALKKAVMASRINTLLSLPMLLSMVAAQNLY